MSHFTLTTLTTYEGNEEELEELLEPYYEQIENDSPYAEFVDKTDEVQNGWDALIADKTPNELEVRNNVGVLEYKTMEEYAREYHNYIQNEDGRWGYMANPNAKWDWWVIGGRWKDSLLHKDGTRCDTCQLKNIDWEGMKQMHVEDAKKHNAGLPEGSPDFFKADETPTPFRTFAILTPENEWLEPGEMGWFGSSSETDDSRKEYNDKFDKILAEADQDLWLTIINCHI